jgi:hypothetical protein
MFAHLRDRAFFATSNQGTASFSVGGTTPTTQNFRLAGQSMVVNALSSVTGSREIPMDWFTGEPLATNDYVLATDFRYKMTQQIGMQGELPQDNGFFITTEGLSDEATPIWTAPRDMWFSWFAIGGRISNGPNGINSVTDTYTIYLNGNPTTMVLTVTDSEGGTCITNPVFCEEGDEIALFVLSDANTLAADQYLYY